MDLQKILLKTDYLNMTTLFEYESKRTFSEFLWEQKKKKVDYHFSGM